MAINLPIVSKYDDKGIKAAEKALGQFGKVAAGVAAAATAAVAGIAVKSIQEFAKFDEQLNKSLAIMGDVSEAMRGNMAEAAREVARTTTFSADQAAESFFFLASAGLDAKAAVAAMPQVAKFAQAGMFDMALATDLATDAQSALGMSSKDATENLANLTRITDVFVRANTLANTSVEQLATAFTTKAGTALKTVGKDVEEGAAALALFADQGVKGEIAGTQLTNTIFGLTDRALKVPGAFEKLGISVFDAEGNMRNFADIADDLGVAFQGMTEEQKLAELGALGFTKQARAGVLMLTGQGDKIREYESALRDAAGFTQDVASKQLLTPTAQFALLQSAIADVGIEIGSVLAPAVGRMASLFSDLVLNSLPAVTDFLETRIVPGLDAFMTGFTDLAVGLREGSLSIGEIFSNLIDRITALFSGGNVAELYKNYSHIMTQFYRTIIDAIPEVVRAIRMLLPAIVNTLAKMIPTMLEAAVETFNALIEAVVVTLPVLLKEIANMLPHIIETIVGLLPSIIDAAIKAFSGIVTAVVEVFPEIIDALVKAFPQILDAIIKQLPNIILAGFDLFTGLIEALFKAMPDILLALFRALPQIIGAVLGLVPKMVDAGFQILNGLGRGIIDSIPRVLGSAVKAIGDFVTKGVQSVFQIKSPSRVFMDIGNDVVAGLGEGITDNLKMLERATLGITSTVTGTVESGFSNMGSPVPVLAPSSASGGTMQLNVTVNAGMGADGSDIGRKIVDEILRFERSSGRVFARA
jgi:TP901 family phage tail tape measure protein